MQDRLCELEINGSLVYYSDFSGLSTSEFIELLELYEARALSAPEKVQKHLINFAGASMGSRANQRAEEMQKKLSQEGITIHSAGFGATALQQVIVNTVQKEMHFFKTEEDARNWLGTEN